ncbi:MAG: hypothetical protein IT210_24270 [Armatimonadetes bacterium]|nr:hypothetical protein [Armatimonadota bacterium]
MANRTIEDQRDHDTTVWQIRRAFKVPVWTLEANPGDEQNRGLDVPTAQGRAMLYPDFIYLEKRTGKLAGVGEVETASTVTAEEARSQWQLFAYAAPRFFLYVPREVEEETLRLCRQFRIRAQDVMVYYYTEKNRFVVAKAGKDR